MVVGQRLIFVTQDMKGFWKFITNADLPSGRIIENNNSLKKLKIQNNHSDMIFLQMQQLMDSTSLGV